MRCLHQRHGRIHSYHLPHCESKSTFNYRISAISLWWYSSAYYKLKEQQNNCLGIFIRRVMTFLIWFCGNNGVTFIRLYRNLLLLIFSRHSIFNSQWHLIGDIKMPVDQCFFSHLIQQEFPLPSTPFLFTELCCSLIWDYFNLLIKYVRSSLCSQELNHVRLTQSPCERIFLNFININSTGSSRNFVVSKPKCQYSG